MVFFKVTDDRVVRYYDLFSSNGSYVG